MAKNIEMQLLNSSGSYEAVYPKTLGENVYLSNGQTVEDKIFSVGVDSAFEVGDTLTTLRNDLSSDWRLCDGSLVDATDEPELCNYLKNTGALNWYMKSKAIDFSANMISISSFAYGNGYYVVSGKYWNSSESYSDTYAVIGYTTDLVNGTWTFKRLYQGKYANTVADDIKNIKYINGYWVIAGGHYDGTKYYGRIGYSTSLDGTWTFKDVFSATYNDTYCNTIGYTNGYWYAGGEKNSSSDTLTDQLAYSTSLSGTWTVKTLGSSGNNRYRWICDCVYYQGIWYQLLVYRNSSGYYQYNIYYGSSIDTITNLAVESTQGNSHTYQAHFEVMDDALVCVLGIGKYYYKYNTSTDATDWTLKNLDSYYLCDIKKINNQYVYLRYTFDSGNNIFVLNLGVMNTLGEDGQEKQLTDDGVAMTSTGVYRIVIDNNKNLWMIGTADSTNYIIYSDGSGLLPTINNDILNVYIKAR